MRWLLSELFVDREWVIYLFIVVIGDRKKIFWFLYLFLSKQIVGLDDLQGILPVDESVVDDSLAEHLRLQNIYIFTILTTAGFFWGVKWSTHFHFNNCGWQETSKVGGETEDIVNNLAYKSSYEWNWTIWCTELARQMPLQHHPWNFQQKSGWVDPSHSSIQDTVDGSEILHQPDMYVWNTVNNGIFDSQLVQHFFHQQ